MINMGGMLAAQTAIRMARNAQKRRKKRKNAKRKKIKIKNSSVPVTKFQCQ